MSVAFSETNNSRNLAGMELLKVTKLVALIPEHLQDVYSNTAKEQFDVLVQGMVYHAYKPAILDNCAD